MLGLQQLVHRTLLVDFLLTPLAVTDTAGRGDVIVVPGAGVNADCSPNLFAIRRTMLSKRLFTEGRAPLILFSGGRGAETPCPVASVMADLARQLGVPPERIVTETEAKSTWDNARYSDALLRKLGARRIVLVTDFLHMRRAAATFSALGYQVERASVPSPDSHQDNMSVLYFGTRELLACAWYLGPGPLRRSCGRAIPTRLRTALPRVRSNALSYSCFRSPRHPRRLVRATVAPHGSRLAHRQQGRRRAGVD